MSILIVDGTKFNPWLPASEDAFEEVVREHVNDIFGESSIYFGMRKKLKSKAGIGSIPDGYAITLDDTPVWYAVEIELSAHPLYDHIVSQLSKFINGISSPQSQKMIVDAIYDEINSDAFLKVRLREAIRSVEIHKFLSDLFAAPPIITVIIEKDTKELREALKALAYQRIKVVEFQTFARDSIGLGVHAHLFEPLFEPAQPPPIPPPPVEPSHALEITLSQPTCTKFHLFYIPKNRRWFFPGYKIPFIMETDIGNYETWVSSAPQGTRIGDSEGGVYVQRNLAPWFKAYPELKIGGKIRVEAVEPMKRYRLTKI